MKEMKRWLSLALCFVMLIGMVPFGALTAKGAETVLDAAIFCSDVHGSSSDLTSVLGGVKTSGVDYSSIGFVGDTCLTVATTTSTVQSALGDTDIAVMFSYASSHDTENSADIADNWDYSGEVEGVSDNYLVYTIRETDMKNSSDASTAAPAFTTWYNGLTDAEKALPIFIMSHRPLHDRRDDNAGAAAWYSAISAAAETSDIVVFWAHNHTGENSTDTAAYYVAKDGSETMTIYNGDTVVPNFTYMNAGYINANNQNPARIGVATTVQITADSLIFQDYDSNGEYTDSSYSHNVTVAREFAAEEVTLSSIAISGADSYTVGDALELTVTATYSDGTTADVTADSTLTGYDMSTAGTYTVTAAYGELTATYGITVADPYVTKIEITTEPTKLTYVTGETLDTTGMVVTATYNNGTTAVVTPTSLTGYDMSTVGEQTVKVNYYVNGTTYSDTFTITVEEAIAADATLTALNITTDPEKTEYLLSQPLDITGMVVEATFSDGTVKTLTYGGFVSDAAVAAEYVYNIESFNMYVAKAQEVSVTFTYGDVTLTDTFTINVWAEDFEDETSGVKVHVASDYGVTAVAVAESVNTHVADAMAAISETYVAYDITLTTDEGYTLTDGEKTVTLPVPETISNPVVWYVSDDGLTVTNMNATNNGNGTVTFVTTHFSTYVLADGTTIETESGNATTENTQKTETVVKEETIYQLVTTPVSGKTYLIVSTNTGTGYGLDGDTTGYATTAVTKDGYYTTWDSATNTGTALGDGTYLTTSGAYLWTATQSGDTWSFGNNGTYVGWTSNGESSWGTTTYTNRFAFSSSAQYWSLATNQVTVNLMTYDGWGSNDSYSDYYLAYQDSAWTMAVASELDSTNVYFYEPVKVYKVTTETTGDIGHTFSTVGTDITDAVAISGNTVTLSSVLYDTPEGGSLTDVTASSGLTPTYEVVTTKGNPNVISSISGSTATLSGVAGTAVVKVTYTYNDLVAWDEFIVTATAPVYGLTVTEPESTQIKIGASTTVAASATINGTADTAETAKITWSSSDESIATVDASTGAVTGVAAGNVTITATYTDPTGKVHTDTAALEVVDAVYSLDLCEPTYTLAESYVEGTTYFVKQEDGTYIADTTVTADTFDATKHYTQSTESITAPIVIKDVSSGQTFNDLWAVIYADGEDLGKLNDEQLAKLTYISSNTNIATVDKTTGHITFQGGTGTVTITCMYEYADGKYVTDAVVFSVSDDHYYVPDDGTNDFPEYPNEGSVRFDKTATAVGNFSKTGITKVELSMTGVPYTTGSEIDVVVMLDMTGSMSDDAISAAEAAAKAFIAQIVKNTDGTYNSNRVAAYQFNTNGVSTYFDLQTISSDSELTTAQNKIVGNQASGGTPFDTAAEYCHDVLAAAKTDGIGDNRQQFCVFMSDGGPTSYEGSDGKTYYAGNNTSGDAALTSVISGYSSSDSSDWVFNVPTEYWTDDMKADGVTVYTVGLLLQTAPNNPAPYSSMTDSTYDSTTDSLTTIGSHYFFTSSILKQMASSEDKYIDIFSVDNADKAVAAFENIAKSILDAAKDVKVTDKISDDFTMVFDAPNTTVADNLPEGQEFYIEVLDYALTAVDNDNDGVVDDYTRGTATSLMKVYLGKNTDGSYYAASDADGTAHATPAFNTTALGTMYYWTTDSTKGDSGVSVVGADGTTYYFVSTGDGTHNMASGAYAYGTPTISYVYKKVDKPVAGTNYYVENADGTYSEVTYAEGDSGVYYTRTESTTYNDLIIATPYFVYNASTRMLVWTAEKLNSSELALSYFLYLDESAGWSGAEGETEAGTYETNDYAYLNYTNFQDTECEQEFPVPQITWNGAQVSYVFYLVNSAGQPVNRAGRVVPFSEAVYVTDTFTHSIVWNDLEQTASLEAEYLAKDLVPEVYKLYDANAEYRIHVFEDEDAQNLNNHFVIVGDTNTTYVFNTKADATKYTAPATYAATATYLCKDYNVTVNADNSITYNGTNTQYTENGVAMVGADDKGAYAIVYNEGASVVATGFDFSNTTVAFAVTWTPVLVEDTVVVDYGLDVVINVTENDALASGVVGVRADAPSGVLINEGTYDAAKAVTADVYIDTNNDSEGLKELKIGTATVESLTQVRFSLDKTNGMQFTDPAVFYYESDVNYYADSNSTNLTQTSMYSKVTVIPATTVYYEDEYVELKTFTSTGTTDADGKTVYTETSGWDTKSVQATVEQAADRPGVSKIGEAYDADNNYGYDGAYSACSTYSLNNSARVNVTTGKYATAGFSFYGTGFDVIGVTSNTTGTMVVKVTGITDTSYSKSFMVDTYYGYTQNADGEWVVSENDPNALYQVPVMQVADLPYGQYQVLITATYNEFFDHTGDGGYDLYLDAIRIYDPTGNQNKTANDAYVADGEGWPKYTELRDNIITAGTFDGTAGVVEGAVFIDPSDSTDSISDYTSYGPNNELYLAPGQAVAFNVSMNDYVADVQLGIKVGNGGPITYEINAEEYTVETATDMYYSIKDYCSGTVVIKNVSGGILSLTNIKVTYTQDPSALVSTASLLWMDDASVEYAVMSLRSAPVVEETPEVTEPEATEPEATEPEATEPEATEPEATEPEATEPEVTEPEATEPEETEPEVTEPTPEAVRDAVLNEIMKAFSNLFSKWFR